MKLSDKCANCGKVRGYHRAKTFNCPTGAKTRVGYIHFDSKQVFKDK